MNAACELIIYAGGIAGAIYSIYRIFTLFGGPAKKIKAKKEEKLKAEVKAIFDVIAPMYHKEHDQDLVRFFDGKGAEMEERIINTVVEEVRKLETEDDRQNAIIEAMTKAIVHSFRQKITNIYHEYEDVQTLPKYVREDLDELYEDYTNNGGNHYIEKLYNRMAEWPVDKTKTTPGE